MPEKDHYVIIGNGPAGNNAADELRKNDKSARVTIISDEPVSYYYRHLLQEFVTGQMDKESLNVRPYEIYKSNNIRLRLGQKVEKIDPENKVLYLRHMEKIGFTKLVLAVGGAPKILPSQVSFEKHLTFMTNYTDAVKLKPFLNKAEKITVLGGDLISLSFIKHLMNLEKKIKFYIYKSSFWPFGLNDKIIGAVSKKLLKNKIETFVEDSIVEIKKTGNKLNVKTESGNKFSTNLVLSFMGLMPNIKFIAGSGIDIERGILVNKNLRTNYKDIYACGDCAQIFNPDAKDYWISIGWDNASHQGKILAINLLGGNKIVKPVSKKFFDIEGIQIKTAWWKGF